MNITLLGFNQFIWVMGNILLACVFVAAVLFSIAYPLLFKITTTGGWRIWRAILSVAGFAVLSVLGIFVDPQNAPWTELPDNVAPWRPLVRIVIYAVIATSFASLLSYLIERRFFPKRLSIPPEIHQLLESDLRLIYGSGTGIPDATAVSKELVAAGWTKAGLIIPPVETLGVVPRTLPKRHL